MSRPIRRVAVLGSGVMGSAIAAHFANTGIPALVLDIVPDHLDPKEAAAGLRADDRRFRDKLAAGALARLPKSRPPALFSPERGRLLRAGNLDDDLELLTAADWVIEVVREDMAIKRDLLTRIAPYIGPDAWLTTNTSGLSVTAMAEVLPPDLRRRFCGTHFFNPPRYMRLLELVPAPSTDPQVLEQIAEFGAERLGKTIVHARDTPNFVANRVGVHAMLATFAAMRDSGLAIEEIDVLTGPALARPKSGTFRLADLVGIDTLAFVAGTLAEHCPDDEARELFEIPAPIRAMIDKGLLGDKSGAGFYRKIKKPKSIQTIDLETLEYRERRSVVAKELALPRGIDDPGERAAALVFAEGKAPETAWRIAASTLSYAAMRLGEIAGDARVIDEAMRAGFNWELGPFELWDALGFRRTTERLRKDGFALPDWVDELYASGAASLYRIERGVVLSPTAEPGKFERYEPDPRRMRISARRTVHAVKSNESASLVDLGDGVLGLEFHGKMNAIDEATIDMVGQAIFECEREEWRALVIANDGPNFCAGANLAMVLGAAQEGRFDDIEVLIRRFQSMTVRLEQANVPVVAAPHGMALGGGAEVVLLADAVQAHAEAYIGLVELGAGLIPAAGGCLRLYRRLLERSVDDPYAALRATFETIAMARVSSSAEEARALGFLRPRDRWSMNREFLLADARERALYLARAGYLPEPERRVAVTGRSGAAMLGSALVNMHAGGFASAHDVRIGKALIGVLAGGDLPGAAEIAPQVMLDLECEAFLSLCGEEKSQERMAALLTTGKPLRN